MTCSIHLLGAPALFKLDRKSEKLLRTQVITLSRLCTSQVRLGGFVFAATTTKTTEIHVLPTCVKTSCASFEACERALVLHASRMQPSPIFLNVHYVIYEQFCHCTFAARFREAFRVYLSATTVGFSVDTLAISSFVLVRIRFDSFYEHRNVWNRNSIVRINISSMRIPEVIVRLTSLPEQIRMKVHKGMKKIKMQTVKWHRYFGHRPCVVEKFAYNDSWPMTAILICYITRTLLSPYGE